MLETVTRGNGNTHYQTFNPISNTTPKMKSSFLPTERPVPISEYFGELTFGIGEMGEKLPRDAYRDVLQALEQGTNISDDTANAVALAVKDWAVSKGATHFCHWFQPLTGLTAEKHDAFISIQRSFHSELKVIERFQGMQLIQGEPDASSFPSGGMRSTFEARGYTAWDPSSPIFIVEGEGGKTLCIPSVFFGYHGEALDHKTPLLRSNQALSKNACDFLKLLGDVDVRKVTATLGTEQEYFLIDRSFASRRPDLLLCGRTVLGAAAPRHQQLEDHYFGSIPSRVKSFMEDVENELYRLGVPLKTRHNEVAPSQFEVAPIYEDVNIAVDHNLLAMDTMKRVANRHGLMCLLNEKPFADINGNGKHSNWSMANDKGENLLEPGKTPHQNLRFLAMVSVVLKAVYSHADVLRASISSPGNDHRLGGNEAPPAIISVFLGSLVEAIFGKIEKGEAAQATEAQIINLGVSHLPSIARDYTDRNRTSPFAFTGNKFEFRAVGGSANVGVPMTALNTAVADAFRKSSERLKELLKKKKTRDEAVVELIKELTSESKSILFAGDNYSGDWVKEAEKRGLPHLETTADALAIYQDPKAVQFFIDENVLSKEEIDSRYNVAVERWIKTVDIELTTLCEMTTEYVIPSVEAQLLRSQEVLKGTLTEPLKKAQAERTKVMEEVYTNILASLGKLQTQLASTNKVTDESKKIVEMNAKLRPLADTLRSYVDQSETLVAHDLWSIPKYREMLFANTVT